VVVFVAELPLVVGNHEHAVADRSNDVVDQWVLGERAVPTVMPHHEHAHEECALGRPVQQDQWRPQHE